MNFWLILALFCLVAPSDAFSSPLSAPTAFSSIRLLQRQRIPKSRLVLSSESNDDNNKEEEIAKLEEQLRKLREETEAEEENSKNNDEASANDAASTQVVTMNSADFVGRGPAKRPVQPMEEMVTEAWKAEQSASEGEEGGGLPRIFGPLVLVALLALLSQVPVGQEDLSKYQGIKTPTTQIDLGDLNPGRPND